MARLLEVEATQGVTNPMATYQDTFATLVFFLALASWCATRGELHKTGDFQVIPLLGE
jgi:hypothetical protein